MSGVFPSSLRERFEPIARLGEGAFGAVFSARDRELDRDVAIKVLHPHADAQVLKRFQLEAEVLAGLRHPGIVQVYSSGIADGYPYLVMELLEGRSLADRQPVDPLETMLGVAEALDVLHKEGLLHRDIKPANILQTLEGRGVLVDFGLVHDPTRTRLTKTGAVVGTLLFLAPELFRGARAAPATDWYAWGVSLFLLLEDQSAWPKAPLKHLVQGKPLPTPRFQRSGEDSPVARLIRAAISQDPDRRPAGLQEIRAILSGELSGEAPPPGSLVEALPSSAPAGAGRGEGRARRLRPVAAAAGLLLIGAAALSVLSPDSPDEPPAPRAEAAASETRTSLLEALERLVAPHRNPDGLLRFAHRVGVIDDHVHEIYGELEDGRVIGRWRRVLSELETWLELATEEEREEGLREEVYPRLTHLQYDEVTLRNKLSYRTVYNDCSKAAERRRFDYELLESRLGEIETERANRLPRLLPYLASAAGSMVEVTLASFGSREARLAAAKRWRTQLAEADSPEERMELAFAARCLFAYGRRGEEELRCEEADALLRLRLQVQAKDRLRTSFTTRARLEASTAWILFEQLNMCRGEIPPGEEERLLRLLRGLDEALESLDVDARDTAAAAAHGITLLHNTATRVTTELSEATQATITELGASLDRLRDRQGGPPRTPAALLNSTLGDLLER